MPLAPLPFLTAIDVPIFQQEDLFQRNIISARYSYIFLSHFDARCIDRSMPCKPQTINKVGTYAAENPIINIYIRLDAVNLVSSRMATRLL